MAGDRARRARAAVRPHRLGQDAGGVPLGARPPEHRLRPPPIPPSPLSTPPLSRSPTRSSRIPSTCVVYVSPLKALAYDIERNLRTPLRGIGAEEVRVGIRTGDTPQRERAAMARNPPDILVTTPESLYLMLTSRRARCSAGCEAVIVDEIHAVAHSKRGAHLALTLERLEAQATRRAAARRATGPAHRPQRDPEPARGDRPLPRRPAPRGHDRRRRRPQATGPAHRGAGRVDGRTRAATAPRRRAHRRRRRASRADAQPIRWSPLQAASPRETRSGRRSTRSC